MVTVSARWTIELVYNLTVGGFSRSHPKNHPVALLSSANVNQQVTFNAHGNQAIPAFLHLNPFPRLLSVLSVLSSIKCHCRLTSTEFKVFCVPEKENMPLGVKKG